jgi:peptidoglycan/LPS O-acetylase OafA/YrhL
MTRAVEKRFGRRLLLPLTERQWGRVRRDAELRRRTAGTGTSQSAIRRALFGPPSGDRLAGLDLLRLLAALAVVAFHLGYAGPRRDLMETGFAEIAPWAKYGFLGVDLFFLISGFVIAASAHGRTWQQFAAARTLRLYPAYLFCMTATALALLLLAGPSLQPSAAKWLANLTMIAPALGHPFMDGAYWSIVVEIVFYGWVAVVVAAGGFDKRLLTVLTVWLGISYLNEVVLHARVLRMGLLTEYAALFASGILIQRLRAGEKNPYAWALLGFAFGLGLIHAFEYQRLFWRLYGDTLSLPVMWSLHVGLYAAFVGALSISRWLQPSRLILAIGGITYPLYLVHQQAGYLLIDELAPIVGRWEALALFTVAALVFSWVVWRFVEPAGRWAMRAIGRQAFQTRAALAQRRARRSPWRFA